MYNRRASDYSSHMSSYDERESPEKTAILEEEEESVGDGLPHPATDSFKALDLLRSDTPETYLSDIGDKPDITLFCDQCRFFIDIRQLKHHRAYHNALLILNYQGNSPPETTQQLLKKRNAALDKLKKEATEESPLRTRQIQDLNEAYELLKSDVEDTYDSCRLIKETIDTSCRGTALSCSPGCVYALGMCSSPNSQWKSEMEDTKVYQDSFGENGSKCYMGLFDGYHGRFSAEVAASLLHKMLLHEMMIFDGSLMRGPRHSSYVAETDISHHRFVFGSDAKVDGDSKDKNKSSRPGTKAGAGDADGVGTAVNIRPEDEDLTQRIIQLCEHKYEKLLEAMSSPPPSAKSTGGKTARARHPEEDKIFKAFEKSYQLLDILLSYGKDEFSKVRWSGCSALSLMIEDVPPPQAEDRSPKDSKREKEADNRTGTSRLTERSQPQGFIHLANAGDTRALLVRGNVPYRISKDHSPHNSKERDRVLREGASLSSSEFDCRVNGVLSTTRGLGNHGDPALKKCVLVEPHTCSVPVDQYAQFVVMATSGVWEILSDEEVASLLMRMLPQNYIPAPSQPSSSLAFLMQPSPSPVPSPQPPGSDRTSVSKRTGSQGGQHRTAAAAILGTVKEADSASEKGVSDAAASEKQSGGEQGKRIQADLKTEAGSHFGGGDSEDHRGNQETVTLPVHSRLRLGGGQGSSSSVPERRRELARLMSEHLVQAALLAGSRNNITVMVILLPGCGI